MLMDTSGYGNNAMINQGVQIATKEGKCDNAGRLLGTWVLYISFKSPHPFAHNGAHVRGESHLEANPHVRINIGRNSKR